MALITGKTERVDVPHEPGGWMAFRRLSASQMRDKGLLSLAALTASPAAGATIAEQEAIEASRVDGALAWVRACLVDWSYDEPFTLVAIDRLDAPTLVWASITAFRLTHGLESVAEKNADSPDSTAGSTGNPAPSAPTTG